MAVQLIPISRKAYLFNLCRDWNAWWNESYLLADNYKSGNKEKEGELILNSMEECVCQICKKKGHTATECRFNKNKKFNLKKKN